MKKAQNLQSKQSYINIQSQEQQQAKNKQERYLKQNSSLNSFPNPILTTSYNAFNINNTNNSSYNQNKINNYHLLKQRLNKVNSQSKICLTGNINGLERQKRQKNRNSSISSFDNGLASNINNSNNRSKKLKNSFVSERDENNQNINNDYQKRISQQFYNQGSISNPSKNSPKKSQNNVNFENEYKNLEEQLIKQLDKAKADIWRFNSYLKNVKLLENSQSAQNNNGSLREFNSSNLIGTENKNPNNRYDFNNAQLEEILELQSIIKSKDIQIKQLSQEIKVMKEKSNKKKNNQNEKQKSTAMVHPLSLLSEQIKFIREQLNKAQKEHAQKSYDFQKKKQTVSKIQSEYLKICLQNDEKPIGFQQFKEKRKQKGLKQEASKIGHKNSIAGIKNFGSLKTKITSLGNINSPTNHHHSQQFSKIQSSAFGNFSQFGYNYTPTIINNLKKKNTNDLQKYTTQLNAKKHVAQNALKNTKKKHQNEIQQLLQKIDFLHEEEQTLDGKIVQKQKQMQTAQTKFNQAKKRERSSRSIDNRFQSVGGIRTPKSSRHVFSSRKLW